jgi:DNA-directed RNA polymerase alpha subunit
VKNLGKKSLDEIKDLMNEIGLPVEQEIEASLKSAFLNKIS